MDLVESDCSKKAKKMFVRLAAYVPTRNPSQIKSHHQKLMIKYGNLETILLKLERELKVSTGIDFEVFCQPKNELSGEYATSLELSESLSDF
jgi:hypothetical protein